jgi:hypothetical protein
LAAAASGWFPDGDAVADDDLFRADEDVFDEQPQDTLAFLDSGGGGVAAQLGEEAVHRAGGRAYGQRARPRSGRSGLQRLMQTPIRMIKKLCGLLRGAEDARASEGFA